MTPKKSGTLFIVLMIALVAYGTASGANALNIGTDIGVGLIPSNFNINGDQKISEIGDPSYSPVHIVRHIQINTTNTTNNTTTPTNNTNNSTNK
jgi:hypothetical protein